MVCTGIDIVLPVGYRLAIRLPSKGSIAPSWTCWKFCVSKLTSDFVGINAISGSKNLKDLRFALVFG